MRRILFAAVVLAMAIPALAQQTALPTGVCNEETPNIPSTLPPHIAEKLRQKDLARIEEKKKLCEQHKQEEAAGIEAAKKNAEENRRSELRRAQEITERDEAARIEMAKKKRRAEEWEAQEFAERRKRELDRIAAQEAEANKPHNRLTQAYFDYIYVRICHGIRKGYLAVWINDVQLERSRKAVAKLKKIALGDASSLDTAKLWSAAESMKPDLYYEWECNEHYENLMRALPKSPEKKDF